MLRFVVVAAPLLVVGGAATLEAQTSATAELPAARQITGPDVGPDPQLVAPKATPSAVNFPRVIGWPAGRQPSAPAGFTVTLFADSLEYPRWLHVLPNGDVLVAEARTQAPARIPESCGRSSRHRGISGRRPTGSRGCVTLTATVGRRCERLSSPG